MNRRDILKGIAALPAIGLGAYEVAKVHVVPDVSPRFPRNLLQVGFTTTQMQEFFLKANGSMDQVLKKKGLIPSDAVLEKCFECATQDMTVFRWQHRDFQPVPGMDIISTCGPSEEWLKVIFRQET